MRRFALLIISLFLLAPSSVFGFGEIAGSCEKDCNKCHQLTKEEASNIFKSLNNSIEVLDVRLSPVRGLWEIPYKMQGRPGIAYLDFSKSNLIEGQITDLKTKTNFTLQRIQELLKVDVSKIPLNGALVMGGKDARHKVIVFDDPE